MKKRGTRKLKGGTILGKGLSGIVHYPALTCKDNSQPTGEYVSKIVTEKNALKEWENTEELRKLKPEFAIYPEYMCEGVDSKYLLFSKFGGYSLTNYYDYLEALAYKTKNYEKKQEFSISYFKDIINALKDVKKDIAYLNKHDIYQGDISFDNILYNENTKKAYLIDFERSKSSSMKNESKLLQYLIDELNDFKSRILK